MILLTPDEMGEADRLAVASGIDSYGLMIKAGHAVAAAVLKQWPSARRAVVLAGPGNNGGDGYVAARVLMEAGMPVALHALGDPDKLGGDALLARRDCPIAPQPIGACAPAEGDLIIDALFGAGLTRDLPAAVIEIIQRIDRLSIPVLAVDLPSGISGATGQPLGGAFTASRTVTFMAPKPGHYLLPGRDHCGTLEIVDIGIPMRLVEAAHGGRLHLNLPALWNKALPHLAGEAHKFSRGHLGVFSGPFGKTGAARLSAMAGLKAGAGLVTLAVPESAEAEVAAHQTAIMQRRIDDAGELDEWLTDKRLSAFVIGPGFGSGEKARTFIRALVERPTVIDADGISAFADAPEVLFELLSREPPHSVLTPHQGEFARLFPDIARDDATGKVDKARSAAARATAVVLYKGADTVIAAPDGRAVINANAPPWLATAGSGDVLAGSIGGLMAQGVPAFEAACAGAFLHGEAGNRAGEGLTAEDLPGNLPRLGEFS